MLKKKCSSRAYQIHVLIRNARKARCKPDGPTAAMPCTLKAELISFVNHRLKVSN